MTSGGFSFNKALGAGLGGVVLGAFGPVLLGLLQWIHPIAGAFNPALGVLVGVLVAVVTWLTPKNVEPAPKPIEPKPEV